MLDDRDHRWMAPAARPRRERSWLAQTLALAVALFVLGCGMGVAALVDRVSPVLVALAGAMR